MGIALKLVSSQIKVVEELFQVVQTTCIYYAAQGCVTIQMKATEKCFLYATLMFTFVNILKNETRTLSFLHSFRIERVELKDHTLPSQSKYCSKQFHIYYNCMLLFLWSTLHISHLPREKRKHPLNMHWQKNPILRPF